MISKDMEKWLNDNLGTFDYPRENCRDTYAFYLQDFTDEQIESVMDEHAGRILGPYSLFEILRASTKDEEVIAHLWGDESAEARRESIRRIRAKQEEMHE